LVVQRVRYQNDVEAAAYSWLNGAIGSYGGNEGLPLVAGPMGRSVDDLVIACQVLFGAFDQARDVAPLPYREVKLPNKLTFGYFIDGEWPKCFSSSSQALNILTDGFVKACPAVARAVEETTQALRQQGHECFELDWPYGLFFFWIAGVVIPYAIAQSQRARTDLQRNVQLGWLSHPSQQNRLRSFGNISRTAE
jgi:Asp-tRNA(Asn)/Glu-tRNA(Gln) amidotransferase A subunit family amidase